MLSLDITFTDDELRELRDAAERANTHMTTFAHDAVIAAARSITQSA